MSSNDLIAMWPAAGVRARAGDLELRWIDDAVLPALAQLAADGIHSRDVMPFMVPWTRGTPDEVARSVLQYEWRSRAEVGPGQFTLQYAVSVGGELVGLQGAEGQHWPILRSAETGSWLGSRYQGKGYGTRMRALILHLLFDGLGALEVTSTAFADNPASNAVSQRTGYELHDTRTVVREGVAATEHRYRIRRDRWEDLRARTAALAGGPIELHGVDRLREQLDAAS